MVEVMVKVGADGIAVVTLSTRDAPLVLKLVVDWKAAEMVCDPAVNAGVMKVVVPMAFSVPLPSRVAPS